jgi:2-hydroxychromene-2-carboxylate isomerase
MADTRINGTGAEQARSRPTLFYDFATPLSYLACERVASEGTDIDWEPVLLEPGDQRVGFSQHEIAEAQYRASELGLAPIRWPPRRLESSKAVIAAAVYAKQLGRGRAFSLAALRQAFAAGRDLSLTDNVLIAAASCELHPRAVMRAIETEAVRARVAQTQAYAYSLGVTELPTVCIDGQLFIGDGALRL